ncbi:unnamed protein product, partial [Thelazia callipaeda]|uniref:MARK3 kinase n=1 Tax=Thelazia callipaeda TaxID=103827 RepID=A0A0N5D822_THECL
GCIGVRASGLPLHTNSSSSSTCSNTALQEVKRPSSRTLQSAAHQLKPSTTLYPPKNKRLSKSSEEDSAYAGFGSSSPLSSTKSSSMSLNSTSSRNSSSNDATANHSRTRTPSALTFQPLGSNHRFTGGTIQPPSSPHVSHFTYTTKST